MANMTNDLIEFINQSPTPFHAVESCAKILEQNGFVPLGEQEEWSLQAGKGYYVTRNQSSIIAFRMPRGKVRNFLITASHTDSPMFKLKGEAISPAFDRYQRLNTENYGGSIYSSWLDRPLSLAGRVVLAQNDKITSHLINFDRDLLIIPNVAIHLNRNVNTGYSYNPAVDLQPLFSQGKDASVKKLIAQELNCREEEIAGYDLFVYNHMSGTVLGVNNEFFSAPRIDNLMCVYGTLQGLVSEESAHAVNVFFAADNEETGSATKQGAGSIFLSDVLDRICEAVQSDRRRLLASSFMISADNAHAKHPNHPELSDPQNAPHMNGGVVIKTNAAQKYATDGISAAVFGEICRHANVPTQPFANRSDMAGGSTLGSISNTKVPLMTVDIGMAQLAMHSAYETAGVKDVAYLVNAMRAFYACDLTVEKDGCYRLSCAKCKVEESSDV